MYCLLILRAITYPLLATVRVIQSQSRPKVATVDTRTRTHTHTHTGGTKCEQRGEREDTGFCDVKEMNTRTFAEAFGATLFFFFEGFSPAGKWCWGFSMTVPGDSTLAASSSPPSAMFAGGVCTKNRIQESGEILLAPIIESE
jgi:hypothetical protein